MRFPEFVDGVSGEGARLVEAALFAFAAMQRDRHDEHFGWSLGRQLCDSRCEHNAKRTGRGMDAIVFERVDGCTQRIVVGSERDGTYERRRRQAAGPAGARGGGILRRGLVEGVAATMAEYAALG